MPRSYVPVLMGLKLPEIFSLLGLCGRRRRARRRVPPRRLRRSAARVLLCRRARRVLPIAVTVMTRPAMYNGIRHFVFVLPPLAVAGGLAAAGVIGARHAARLASWRRALAVVFAAGVACR